MKKLELGIIKNKHVRNISIYFIGSFILQAIGFISMPIFTRVLSTSDYGSFIVFKSAVSAISIIITLRVSASIPIARVHYSDDKFSSYMRDLVILAICIAMLFSILVLIFSDFISNILKFDSFLLFHVMLQSLGMDLSIIYTLYTIQVSKPKANVIFSLLLSVSIIILSLVFINIVNEPRYHGRIYGASLAYVFVILFVVWKFFSFPKLSPEMYKNWKFALFVGSPMVLHLFSNIIISQSDRIMIKYYLGSSQTAIYGVSYTIATLGLLVSEVLNKVWIPWYFKNTKQNNTSKINELLKYYLNIMALVFSLLIYVSPEILMVLAPPEYSSGVTIIPVIIMGIYFQFLYRFPLSYEQYMKKTVYIPIFTLFAAIINIIINIISIKKIGIAGASISTAISYILLFLVHEIFSRKIIKNYNINLSVFIPGVLIIAISLFLMYVSIYISSNIMRVSMIIINTMAFISYSLSISHRFKESGKEL